MVKLVAFTILSKLRFIFYPFATFPDPLETIEYKSALDIRHAELVQYDRHLGERAERLTRRERAVEKQEKDLKQKRFNMIQNENQIWTRLHEEAEIELTDFYGNKVYVTKK